MRQEGRGRPVRVAATPLGKFLLRQLKLKGITLSEFARQLDVSRSTVNRLLYGEPRSVSSSTAVTICRVLAFDDVELSDIHKLLETLNRPISEDTQVPASSPVEQ